MSSSAIATSPPVSDLAKQASDSLRNIGNTVFARGDCSAAIRLYTAAIAANPGDSQAWLERSLAHLKLQNWAMAEFDATSAIDLQPSDIAYFRRAGARQFMGRLEGAKRDINQILLNTPSHEPALCRLREIQDAIHQRTLSVSHPITVLDHTAFPHILDLVFAYADSTARFRLSQTCRVWHQRYTHLCHHSEVTVWSDKRGVFAQFTQPAPLGRTFRVYWDYRVRPKTPEERFARTMSIASIVHVHCADTRGNLPLEVVTDFCYHTAVLRIRPDKNGRYPDGDIDLSTNEHRKVVIFGPPNLEQGTTVDIGLDPPSTVTRLVYPIVVDACGDALTRRTTLWPNLYSRFGVHRRLAYTQEQAAVVVAILCNAGSHGLAWGAHTVKIVNIEGCAPLWMRRKEGEMAAAAFSADHHLNDVDRRTKRAAVLKTSLVTHINAALRSFEVQHLLDNPRHRFKRPPPDPDAAIANIQFLTEDEYRATLKPGEWEEETVEVFPGFE